MSVSDLSLVIAVRRLYGSGNGRLARQALGVSLSELSRAAGGVSVATIWRYENGTRVPATSQALALARAFESLTPERIPNLLAVVTDAGGTG